MSQKEEEKKVYKCCICGKILEAMYMAYRIGSIDKNKEILWCTEVCFNQRIKPEIKYLTTREKEQERKHKEEIAEYNEYKKREYIDLHLKEISKGCPSITSRRIEYDKCVKFLIFNFEYYYMYGHTIWDRKIADIILSKESESGFVRFINELFEFSTSTLVNRYKSPDWDHHLSEALEGYFNHFHIYYITPINNINKTNTIEFRRDRSH